MRWPELDTPQRRHVKLGETFLTSCVDLLDRLTGSSKLGGKDGLKGKRIQMLGMEIYEIVVDMVMDRFNPEHNAKYKSTLHHFKKKQLASEHEELKWLYTLYKICVLGPQVIKRHGTLKGLKNSVFRDPYKKEMKTELLSWKHNVGFFASKVSENEGAYDADTVKVMKENFSSKSAKAGTEPKVFDEETFTANYGHTVGNLWRGGIMAARTHKKVQEKHTDNDADTQVHLTEAQRTFLMAYLDWDDNRIAVSARAKLKENLLQEPLQTATRTAIQRVIEEMKKFDADPATHAELEEIRTHFHDDIRSAMTEEAAQAELEAAFKIPHTDTEPAEPERPGTDHLKKLHHAMGKVAERAKAIEAAEAARAADGGGGGGGGGGGTSSPRASTRKSSSTRPRSASDFQPRIVLQFL